MGIESVTRYVVQCDRCDLDIDELYEDKSDAAAAADAAGYVERGDKWLCKHCAVEPEHEERERLQAIYGLSRWELQALVRRDPDETARLLRERPRLRLAVEDLERALS